MRRAPCGGTCHAATRREIRLGQVAARNGSAAAFEISLAQCDNGDGGDPSGHVDGGRAAQSHTMQACDASAWVASEHNVRRRRVEERFENLWREILILLER
ncbi:hypothetical protein CMUS01_05089 [Colletotrichum musicola]|uniref:Uncharacterized protein n=1 Tax=Colletotrichum musicola TaxID=2175873 RepID=A0A8H6NKY6_9PEZI|nr:hypothetical protein CMUS01_05089 [Colletotrichum musicola]